MEISHTKPIHQPSFRDLLFNCSLNWWWADTDGHFV